MTNDNLPTLLTSQTELLEFVTDSLRALSAQVALCFKEKIHPEDKQLRAWQSMLLQLADLTEHASKL